MRARFVMTSLAFKYMYFQSTNKNVRRGWKIIEILIYVINNVNLSLSKKKKYVIKNVKCLFASARNSLNTELYTNIVIVVNI